MIDPDNELDDLFEGPVFRVAALMMIFSGGAFLYFLFRQDFQSMFWAWIPALVSGGYVAWRVFRGMRQKYVVVWLRRFHRDDKHLYSSFDWLQSVGLHSFQILTIQDSVYKYSMVRGLTKIVLSSMIIAIVVILPASIFAAALLVGVMFDLRGSGAVTDENRVFVVGSFFGAAIVSFFSLHILIQLVRVRRRGFTKLRAKTARKKVSKWIEKTRKGINLPGSGLKIFKCGDEFWKDAVESALQHADAVFVDVTDVNENVAWELEQCVRYIGASRMILGYSVPKELYPASPGDPTLDYLEQVVGWDVLSDVVFWPYPAEVSKTLFGLLPDIDDETSSEVVESLEASFQHVLGLEQGDGSIWKLTTEPTDQ